MPSRFRREVASLLAEVRSAPLSANTGYGGLVRLLFPFVERVRIRVNFFSEAFEREAWWIRDAARFMALFERFLSAE